MGARNPHCPFLAEKLGCSVKPIFGLFDTMDEVRQAVWEQANAWYIERLDAAMSAGDRPPYLASGLAYIEFARTEPNLFTLLFMHRRTPEQMEQSSIQLRPVIEIIARQLGVGYDKPMPSICECGCMCMASPQ